MTVKFVCKAALKRIMQVYNPLATILKLHFFLKTWCYFITLLAAKHGLTWYEAIDTFYLSHLVQTFIHLAAQMWMCLIMECCADSRGIFYMTHIFNYKSKFLTFLNSETHLVQKGSDKRLQISKSGIIIISLSLSRTSRKLFSNLSHLLFFLHCRESHSKLIYHTFIYGIVWKFFNDKAKRCMGNVLDYQMGTFLLGWTRAQSLCREGQLAVERCPDKSKSHLTPLSHSAS